MVFTFLCCYFCAYITRIYETTNTFFVSNNQLAVINIKNYANTFPLNVRDETLTILSNNFRKILSADLCGYVLAKC